jgi:hypothetical protein
MGKRLTCFMVAGLASLSPVVAGAQQGQPGTDTDLRAAYCLAADNVQLSALTSGRNGLPASTPAESRAYLDKQIANLSSDVGRLRAYVIPKIQYVDPLAITAAAARGKADIAASLDEVADCQASTRGVAEQMTACLSHAPAGSRVRACQGATFLPY